MKIYVLPIVAVLLAAPAEAQTILFDLENATLRSGLPVNVTVGGVTARFSATGQGFSMFEL